MLRYSSLFVREYTVELHVPESTLKCYDGSMGAPSYNNQHMILVFRQVRFRTTQHLMEPMVSYHNIFYANPSKEEKHDANSTQPFVYIRNSTQSILRDAEIDS